MTAAPMSQRPATVQDADLLVELVDISGAGLPGHIWARSVTPDQSAYDVGRLRAQGDSGPISWRHATIAEIGGDAAGCLIAYPLAAHPAPADPADPPEYGPMTELEAMVPGSFFVNIVATYPGYRRMGLGSALLATAVDRARTAGCPRLSLIVSDVNDNARRLYRAAGYGEIARRPVAKSDWDSPNSAWVLMTKDI
ncbi:GNAT family N-acetyltransferase [Mesobaculum littorinae]|nr:GNAT family N-acetyltransferase [Mesobaculum littorinae]